jgi:hypothetical protein
MGRQLLALRDRLGSGDDASQRKEVAMLSRRKLQRAGHFLEQAAGGLIAALFEALDAIDSALIDDPP